MTPLAIAAAVVLLAAEGGAPARPGEGSDAANAARAKAGLLPRKRPPQAKPAHAPTPVPTAAPDPAPAAAAAAGPAPAVVAPAAAPAPPEPRGWLRVVVDAARALDGSGPPAPAAVVAAIEDVRARTTGLRVEGRLSVRAGGVTLGAASTSGEQPIGLAPSPSPAVALRTPPATEPSTR